MDFDFNFEADTRTKIGAAVVTIGVVFAAVCVAAFFTCIVHGVGIWFGAGW